MNEDHVEEASVPLIVLNITYEISGVPNPQDMVYE